MNTVQANPTILVIDDNATNLGVLTGYLRGHGFQLMIARNGSDGLTKARLGQPDLILLDVIMPDMDGFEVCRRLKAAPETNAIPVIFITALQSVEDKVKGFAAGGVDYLTKPLQEAEVFARVRTHVLFSQAQKHLQEHNRCLQREVAERIRAEQALQQARAELEIRVAERTAELRLANTELAKALRLKDEFLAAMSHELHTPLHIILGMSGALLEGVYGTLHERMQKSIALIEENGQCLLAVLNHVLDFAHLSTGKLQLEIAPVDVNDVCADSLRMIAPLAENKHITISAALLAQDNRVMIRADERRVKQMLVCLLDNAVKFTPEGGAIGLEVAADAEARVVALTVKDTGIGLADHDRDRLFQPFIQLDASLARKYEGTGLGLALVASLAKLHGGSISVESAIGQGSRFTLTLPWNIASEAQPRPGQL